MFKQGEALRDERFGERYTFLKTAAETHDALVRVEDVVQPGPSSRPASAHPDQEERFEVIAGTLGLLVNGKEHLLRPGESFLVQRGVDRSVVYWAA